MFRYLNTINMKKLSRAVIIIAAIMGAAVPAMAQGPKPESSLNNPLALTLVVIIAALALIIGLLAVVVYGAAEIELKKQKTSKPSATALTILALLIATAAGAQDAAPAATAAASDNVGGLSGSTYYILMAVLLVEVAAIFFLLFQLRFLLGAAKPKITEASTSTEGAVEYKPAAPQLSWWDKFNKFRPVEKEADIDLGHEYDGIRELDNRLPPWWLYGFYITIIFAVVYFYRAEVSHAAPSSAEEYQAAVAKANAQQEERLKDQKNRVDENTVVLITDKAELEKGKTVFMSTCTPCHGQQAQGIVGPNLTDDYWIHGGKINDIFKTIKYGYPEKSMQSWKDQLSPVQIAEVASYIKSLRGTNPPGAKEKQGELYTEDGSSAPAADSTGTAKADSTKPAVK
ncbi:MAG: c-type cytochrome [Sphingobacteriales bacterium]|nr:c-type cytochrome [Sphingobacteriales bacterium]MBI3716995.1 c-type cytochrome [Sphingobacteriales bacterium]